LYKVVFAEKLTTKFSSNLNLRRCPLYIIFRVYELEIVFEEINCLVTIFYREIEMKTITMDKARCYVNFRGNEEKPKEHQHLTVSRYKLPNRLEES